MLKKLYVLIPLLLVFVLLFTSLTPVVTMSENISDKVFRLHILANSDNEYDQKLKLLIRDKVLRISNNIFIENNSLENTINVVNQNIDYIKSEVRKTIAFYGYDYDIDAYVAKEYYKTRIYDTFTLPSGEYYGLKIVIGEGKGHNWWCVMYPSVCISGSINDFKQELTDDEIKAITDKKYIVKFKSIELYEYYKNKMIKNKS